MGSINFLPKGMEVPVIDTNSVVWLKLTIPSTSGAAAASVPALPSSQEPAVPSPVDVASYSIIGDPPNYVLWRIDKSQPHVMEAVELRAYEKLSRIGLRIIFPEALVPFAFLCKDMMHRASGSSYMLYALTTSGVVYLLRLRDFNEYACCSLPFPDELVEYNTGIYLSHASSVAATAGCILIGRTDGSVSCFQLGMLDPSDPGFVHELRDNGGLGLLWGMMARRKAAANVNDLVISEVHGKKLIFVLHSDGVLRVWDTLHYTKLFSHSMNNPSLTGVTFAKLWVGEADSITSVIPVAILCKSNMLDGVDIICTYCFTLKAGEDVIRSVDFVQSIPLEEGELIDVKVTSKSILLLEEDKLIEYHLNYPNLERAAHCFLLQETFISEQLFQNASNDLWLVHTLFSSQKEIASFVSSIFLRRLLCPGVYCNEVLQATLRDFSKNISDSEFQLLSIEELKTEILTLIEHAGLSKNTVSVIDSWRNFCQCYFLNWCKQNAACGLLVDSSTGAIGLIRKKSVSLFRSLEDVELLSFASLDESSTVISTVDFSNDLLDRETLVEVLPCINIVNQQLGKAAFAVFYESLVTTPRISSDEVISHLLKILEMGYCASTTAPYVLELGGDIAWEKEVVNHKNVRKFSVEIFSSLHALLSKAASWSKVLDVIESCLKFLVPRKNVRKTNSESASTVDASVTVHATSQVAKVMSEAALDLLLFLSYLTRISGQICMLPSDVSRIQLELLPMIQEVIMEWHIIHFFVTTPSESPAIDDFSSKLSSLQIDGNTAKESWKEKLGKCDFPLAILLLLNVPSFFDDNISSKHLPEPSHLLSYVRDFASWIIWGKSGEESSVFFKHSIELSLSLLKHGQYDAVEYLITMVDTHSCKEKISRSRQSVDGEWSILFHLLGWCLLSQAHYGSHGKQSQIKVCEAIRCFFRASSMEGASGALQRLSQETELPQLGFSGSGSVAAWKLNYYQWVMQIFEQYDMEEAACQFALASLEQVDEAFGSRENCFSSDSFNESAIAVKGRLWANVFKFSLDLTYYYDAYCAITSNPDEESRNLCLRRFIIVLYERGASKMLCDGSLPFIGLMDKVERELTWKAERSVALATPNPFKLLYAFELHRHNWRKAASYIYRYSSHLKSEAALKDHQCRALVLQERLNALSAAINALHLVHPAYAWIDSLPEVFENVHYPSKRARITALEHSGEDDAVPGKLESCVDIEKLEDEYVLTSAEYMLCLANIKWIFTGNGKPSPDLVDLLVESCLYDMAFTVVLKFWKGSEMRRQLERIFATMTLKCCSPPKRPMSVGNDHRKHGFLLTSSEDEVAVHGSFGMAPSIQKAKGNSQWETLQLYLEKYSRFHPRLPIVVAETFLSADSQIELPLWLVHMFKCAQRGSGWGMTGNELDSASLFRLYVDYGRYAEATNLILEYLESFTLLRPTDVIRRKKPFAVWFPYTLIERLWCQLEELIRVGHEVDLCEKLKNLLRCALQTHLYKLRVDSQDVQSSFSGNDNLKSPAV